jgi:hypothetical protein
MVCQCRKWSGWLWLVMGLMGGLVLAGFWPSTPLHAVATDRFESFAVATGPVDEATEAVYFMDFLTGDLSAVVIGKMASGGFGVTGHYGINVGQALNVGQGKKPRFLMVTGMADLARGGRASAVQPSKAVVYVAEVTSGRCAAFAIPFNAQAHRTGRFTQAALVSVAVFPFRNAAAPGPAKGKNVDEE